MELALVLILMFAAFTMGHAMSSRGRDRESSRWSTVVLDQESTRKAERDGWRDERALLVRALLHMKRSGFDVQVVDPEAPLESWVIDDEYEREVEDTRAHGGVSRADRELIRDAMLDGIRSKDLPDSQM
jgi:hypothetical protein